MSLKAFVEVLDKRCAFMTDSRTLQIATTSRPALSTMLSRRCARKVVKSAVSRARASSEGVSKDGGKTPKAEESGSQRSARQLCSVLSEFHDAHQTISEVRTLALSEMCVPDALVAANATMPSGLPVRYDRRKAGPNALRRSAQTDVHIDPADVGFVGGEEHSSQTAISAPPWS